MSLQDFDFDRLQSLVAIGNTEFDPLCLAQGTVTSATNRAEMHENIAA